MFEEDDDGSSCFYRYPSVWNNYIQFSLLSKKVGNFSDTLKRNNRIFRLSFFIQFYRMLVQHGRGRQCCNVVVCLSSMVDNVVML